MSAAQAPESGGGVLAEVARGAREVFALFWSDGYGRFGLCVLCAFTALAALCPWIATHDPWVNNTRPDGALARLNGPSAAHLLGTTFYGQDVFSQLVLATPQTLLVGIVTAVLVGFIGTNVGLVSGYFGGAVDDVLMRITDFFYAIPFLPFMMVVVSFLGTSVAVVVGSMSLVFWRTAARVVRSQVLTVKQRPYVLAARASGAGHARIIYRHILPNVLPLSFLYLLFGAAWGVLTESSLSFIGLGDPSRLSWGLMLNQAFATGSIRYAWWWVVPPGAALTLFMVSLYLLGRAFEEHSSPRLRQQ